MVELMLTESRQSALRRLLAAEPVPGEPLPPRPVLDAVADLVPCDFLAATLTDGQGTRLQQLYLAPGPDHRTRVVGSPWGPGVPEAGDRPARLGWIHSTQHPEPAEGCRRRTGADQLAIAFRNGVDHVVQLELARASRVFSEEELGSPADAGPRARPPGARAAGSGSAGEPHRQ